MLLYYIKYFPCNQISKLKQVHWFCMRYYRCVLIIFTKSFRFCNFKNVDIILTTWFNCVSGAWLKSRIPLCAPGPSARQVEAQCAAHQEVKSRPVGEFPDDLLGRSHSATSQPGCRDTKSTHKSNCHFCKRCVSAQKFASLLDSRIELSLLPQKIWHFEMQLKLSRA